MLVDLAGVGGNLIDHPFMSAALSSDASKRSEGTDHGRFSALLRYTARGSDEFNDTQLYVTPIVDLGMWPGAPFSRDTPPIMWT